jgi:hypothetical protein
VRTQAPRQQDRSFSSLAPRSSTLCLPASCPHDPTPRLLRCIGRGPPAVECLGPGRRPIGWRARSRGFHRDTGRSGRYAVTRPLPSRSFGHGREASREPSLRTACPAPIDTTPPLSPPRSSPLHPLRAADEVLRRGSPSRRATGLRPMSGDDAENFHPQERSTGALPAHETQGERFSTGSGFAFGVPRGPYATT